MGHHQKSVSRLRDRNILRVSLLIILSYPDALQIIRQKDREINLLAEEKSFAVRRVQELQLRWDRSHDPNLRLRGTPDSTVLDIPLPMESPQSSSTGLIAESQKDDMNSLNGASQGSLQPLPNGLETEPSPELQPQTSDSGHGSRISMVTCETTDASVTPHVKEQQIHLPNSSGSACSTPDHVHTIENTPILQTFSKGLLKDYESCLDIVDRLSGFFVDVNDLLFLRDGIFDVNSKWLTPIPSKSLSSIMSAVEWVHTNTADLMEALRVRTEQREFLTALRRYSHDPETDLFTSARTRKRKAIYRPMSEESSRAAFVEQNLNPMRPAKSSIQLHNSSGHDASSILALEGERRCNKELSSIEAATETETIQSLTKTTVEDFLPTAEQLLRELTDFFTNDIPSSSGPK